MGDSYWAGEDAINAWREHPDHIVAKDTGRSKWYDWYELRVAHVKRATSFTTRP